MYPKLLLTERFNHSKGSKEDHSNGYIKSCSVNVPIMNLSKAVELNLSKHNSRIALICSAVAGKKVDIGDVTINKVCNGLTLCHSL